MKIIISPAKKMREDDSLACIGRPVYLEKTQAILSWLRQQDSAALKKLWGCSEELVELNLKRLAHMDLNNGLTPAILAYDGIQYQYMAPGVFQGTEFSYIQAHVRILSGFYGILAPMDGVTAYRLEMQAKAQIAGTKNLYEYWGKDLYLGLQDEDRTIVNLASKEYSKAVEKYLTPEDRYITVDFAELAGGKLVQKGVYAKMARGETVRLMASNNIQKPEVICSLQVLSYSFAPEYSSADHYVFLK